jgi:hypothetical protein
MAAWLNSAGNLSNVGLTALWRPKEMELAKPDEPLDLEIIVGPNPQTDPALEAVKALLAQFNCKGTCRQSAVPYREI